MNVKRILCAFLVLILSVALLVSCDREDYSEPSGEISKDKYYFHAIVLEAHEKYIMVKPVDDAAENLSASLISVSLTLKSGELAEGFEAGDKVRIVYNGQIMESYPAQIAGAYEIVVVEKGELENEQSVDPSIEDKQYFNAKVIEVYEDSILVSPTEEYLDRIGDIVNVSLTLQTGEVISGIKVGDLVRVVHTGQIMQSYPPKIGGPYEITVITE